MLARDVIHYRDTFQFVVIRLRIGLEPTYNVVILCGWGDSNSHPLSGTSPSNWRVYHSATAAFAQILDSLLYCAQASLSTF